MSIGCNNAAATMFRLCVDLATRPLLPDAADPTNPQPNRRTRRDLGLRLTWMFDNNTLPATLRELASCIREDANDGAHVGNLIKEDAEDLLDFTRYRRDEPQPGQRGDRHQSGIAYRHSSRNHQRCRRNYRGSEPP
ncbi:MAG: DUF4145 domain-containing protein, partial [Stellaceae bacterium]